MKVSMQVTLDGLLRALRWRAHNIAEEVSASRGAEKRAAGSEAQRQTRRRTGMKDLRDDRARR